MTLWQKVKYITGRIYTTIANDSKYIFCFVAVLMTSLVAVLYSIYLILWITSFVITGVLESE